MFVDFYLSPRFTEPVRIPNKEVPSTVIIKEEDSCSLTFSIIIVDWLIYYWCSRILKCVSFNFCFAKLNGKLGQALELHTKKEIKLFVSARSCAKSLMYAGDFWIPFVYNLEVEPWGIW